jgi:hypothetical protein
MDAARGREYRQSERACPRRARQQATTTDGGQDGRVCSGQGIHTAAQAPDVSRGCRSGQPAFAHAFVEQHGPPAASAESPQNRHRIRREHADTMAHFGDRRAASSTDRRLARSHVT